MSTLFWVIGILFSSLYYFLVRKKFMYSILESIILIFAILLCEILGAKLLFILENIHGFSLQYLDILKGYSLFGVFIFTPVFLLLFSFLLKKDIKNLLDYFISGMLLELAFYRVGCFFGGCCGGIDVNFFGNVFKFPTRIFEIIFCIIMFSLIVIIKFKYINKPLFIYILVVISYSVFRFVLEFLRVRNNVLGLLSVSHFIALAVFIKGVLLLILYSKGLLLDVKSPKK